jgi:hypothetical protein
MLYMLPREMMHYSDFAVTYMPYEVQQHIEQNQIV